MRTSLSFITATSAIAHAGSHGPAADAAPRRLEVLGHDDSEHRLYMLEHVQDTRPRLLAMATRGRQAGRMLPMIDTWLDMTQAGQAQLQGRIAALGDKLVGLVPVDRGRFHMHTRVARRQAVTLEPGDVPVRRYELQITVRPRSSERVLSMGTRTTVTAFLRARAQLDRVLAHPRGDFSVALVSYVGIPWDIGHDKQVALLVPQER